MEKIQQMGSLFVLVIAIAILISVVKFIISEKKTKEVSYSELLIQMIKSLKYKKDVLNNNYPPYTGELESKDTNEYIDFLDTGILQKFDDDE